MLSDQVNTRSSLYDSCQSKEGIGKQIDRPFPFDSCPTDYRIGFSEASPSRKVRKRGKPRKRPHKSNRKPKVMGMDFLPLKDEKKKGILVGKIDKRKAIEEAGGNEIEAHNHKQIRIAMEGKKYKLLFLAQKR